MEDPPKEATTVETATPDGPKITEDSTTVNKEEATSGTSVQKNSPVGTDPGLAADATATTTSSNGSAQEETTADLPPSKGKEPEIPVDNEVKQVSQETIAMPPSITTRDSQIGTEPSVNDPVVEATGSNEKEEVALALSNNVEHRSLSDTESDKESLERTTNSKDQVKTDVCVDSRKGVNEVNQPKKPEEKVTKEILPDEQKIELPDEPKIENGAVVDVESQAKNAAAQPPEKVQNPSVPEEEPEERRQDKVKDPNTLAANASQMIGTESSSGSSMPSVKKRVKKRKKVKHKREWRPRAVLPLSQMRGLQAQNSTVTSAQAAMASISQMASRLNTTGELQKMQELIHSKKEDEKMLKRKTAANERGTEEKTEEKPTKKSKGRPKKEKLPVDSMRSAGRKNTAFTPVAPILSNGIDYDMEENSSNSSTISYPPKRTSIYDDSEYSRDQQEVRKRQKKRTSIYDACEYSRDPAEVRKRQKIPDEYHRIARFGAPSPVQEAAPLPAEGTAIFTTIQSNLNELLQHPHVLQAVGMNPWQLKIAAGLLAGGLHYATAAAAAAKKAQQAAMQQAATAAYYAAAQQQSVQPVVAQNVDPGNMAHHKMVNANGNTGYFNVNGMAKQGPASRFGPQDGMWGGYPAQRPEFDVTPAMPGRPDPEFSHIRNAPISQQPQRHSRRADPPADPPGGDDYDSD